jgi:hypothetical protein
MFQTGRSSIDGRIETPVHDPVSENSCLYKPNPLLHYWRIQGVNQTKEEKMDKKQLCDKITSLYPDIGECGIDVDVEYDDANERWTVNLKKDKKELKTFLEPGDADLCMEGKQCVSLAIEINQLKDSLDRRPL